MKFQKMKIDPPKLYWTSRATNFDKDIWYESSPGCCENIYFPYATYLLSHYPRLTVRILWLLIQICKLIKAYPSPYPNLICCVKKSKA